MFPDEPPRRAGGPRGCEVREDHSCPRCGGQTDADEVDIGVGVMRGPRGCIDCGWSEDKSLDMADPANAGPDERGGYRDQFGGYHPAGSSMARAFRLAALP